MGDLFAEVTRGVPRARQGQAYRGRDALNTAGGAPSLRNSPAYEVDDLQLVAFGKVGGRPIGSRDNISIQFHGYAVLLHTELFDQQGQGGRREGLFLPVDDDFHYSDFRNYRATRQAPAT